MKKLIKSVLSQGTAVLLAFIMAFSPLFPVISPTSPVVQDLKLVATAVKNAVQGLAPDDLSTRTVYEDDTDTSVFNQVDEQVRELLTKYTNSKQALFFDAPLAQAAVVTWDGGGGDNNWSTCANWSDDTCPGTSDIATFDATSTNDATIDENISVQGIDINSGYTGTITQSGAFTITIGTGAYAQDDGIFVGGSGIIDINTSSGSGFTLTSGSFTSTAGVLSTQTNFTITGGTFTHNSGTVTIDGSTGHSTISCNSVTFNLVVINKGSTGLQPTFSSDCTVPLGNNPTTTGYITNNGTINVGTGTWTSNGHLVNAGTITMTGSTLDVDNGAYTYQQNTGGSLTMGSSPTILVGSNFDINAGSTPADIDLNITDSASTHSTIDCTSVTFNSVVINKSGSNLQVTFSSNCTIPLGNSPTTTGWIINNGTINVGSGTWTSNGHLVNAGTITMTGSTLDVDSGNYTYQQNTGGSLTMGSSPTILVGSNFDINAGTMPADIDLTIAGAGHSTIDCTSVTFNSVVINKSGSNLQVTFSSNCTIPLGNSPTTTGWIINNGTINVGSGTWTSNGHITNAGTITMTGSTLDAGAYNYRQNTGGSLTMGSSPTILVGFNFDINAGSTPADIDLNITDSYGGHSTIDCTSVTFNSVVINKSSSGLQATFSSNCTIPLGNSPTTTGWIINNGTINVGTGTWTSNGSITNAGTIIMTGSTLDVDGGAYTYQQNTGGSLTMGSSPTILVGANFDINAGTTPADIDLNITDSASTSSTIDCTSVTFNSVTVNKGLSGYNVTFSPNCTTVNGDFTRTQGVIANPSSALTMSIGGNLSISGTEGTGGSNLTFSLSGSDNQSLTLNAGDLDSKLAINKSGGVASLATSFTTNAQTCDVVEGTFNLNGQSFTCGSTFTVQDGGILQVFGSETTTSPTLSSGSTVTFTGDGDAASDTYTITDQFTDYHHLTFNSTDGATDTFQTNGNITVAGNWTNTAGTFDATTNTNTVTFDGTSQTLAGDTTFYNFTKTEGADDTTDEILTFTAADTFTITNTWTLDGRDDDDRINLVSSSPGNQWNVDPQGTRTLDFIDVTDSNNVNGTAVDCSASECVQGGNNTNWTFPLIDISIAGTVYSDEGSTPLGSVTVAVSVNGAAATTVEANGSGVYSFATVSVNSGDVVTLYLEDETQDAVTVTRVAEDNLTGVDLYQSHLITRSDNGVALTNANLDVGNDNADADITGIYTNSGSVITLQNANTLFIPSGHSYTPGADLTIGSNNSAHLKIDGGTFTQGTETITVAGRLQVASGTFTGGSGTIDLNSTSGGGLILDSGTFTSTSGTLSISEDLDLNGGTFTHNSGTVQIDGTATTSILDCNSSTFSTFVINKSSASRTVSINSDCTIPLGDSPTTTGSITNNGTINVGTGTWTSNGYVVNAGTIAMTGSTLDLTPSGYGYGQNTGGSLTMGPSPAILIGANFDINAGTMPADIDLTIAGSTSSTIDCTSVTFNSVVLNKPLAGYLVTFSADCTIPLGNSPTTTGSISNSGGTINVGTGTWTSNGSITNAGTITMTGSTLDMDGSTYSYAQNTGGSLTMGSSPAILVGANFDINAGTTPADIDLTIAGSTNSTIDCTSVTFNSVTVNKGLSGYNVTFSSNCTTVNGDFTRTQGTIPNPSSALTMSIGGNLSISGTEGTGGSNLTFSLSGSDNQSLTLNAGDLDSKLAINKSGGVASLATSFTTNAQTCDVVEGTFNLNGQSFTCGSTFTVQDGGILQVFGSETTTSPTLSSGSTVTFTGDGDAASDTYTITDQFTDYHHLTFNSTDGATDTFQTNGNITVAGNWTNTAGTFDATTNTNTVTFDGTSQTLAGDTTFYNFTKTEGADDTTDEILTFTAADTFTITNTWTLDGRDDDDRINLVSSSPGNQWNVDPQGTRTLDFIDVTDSNNVNGTIINCLGCEGIDGGNNTNWLFAYSIAGTIYSDEGTTPITSVTVALSINGAAATTVESDGVDGTYEFSDLDASANDVVTLYLDDETPDAVTVSKLGTDALTGIDLYQNRLITRSDNGVALTNTNLDTANNNGDADILAIYTMSGTTLNVVDGKELFIPTSQSFTPGSTTNIGSIGTATASIDVRGTLTHGAETITVNGAYSQPSGTFTGGSGSFDARGDWTLSGGTFTSTSGIFTLGFDGEDDSNWTHTAGGTFNHNNGTVKYVGCCSNTFDVATTETFYNLEFDSLRSGNGTTNDQVIIASGDTLVVENDFTHTDGSFNTGTVEVRGDVTVASTTLDNGGGTGTISMIVSGDQTITGNGGRIPNLSINKPSGTVSMGTTDLVVHNLTLSSGTLTATSGTLTVGNDVTSTGAWTHTAGGTFNHNNGTVSLSGLLATIDVISTETFYDLDINDNRTSDATIAGSRTIATSDTLIVLNDFSHTDGTINGGTIQVQGDVFIDDDTADFGGGTTQLQFTGGNSQTYTDEGGNEPDGDVLINKSAGTVTLASNADWSATSQDVTVTAGTLDLVGFDITTNVLTVTDTLRLEGDEAVTASTTSFENNSTAVYYGAGTYASGLVAGDDYYHLTFDGTGSWTLAAALDTDGNFTITQGTVATGGNNATVAGNFTNNGTFTHGNAIVTLDGTTTGKTITHAGSFYDLVINGSGGYWDAQTAVTIANDLTITVGTLDINGNNIDVTGAFSNSGTLRLQGSETVGLTNDTNSGTITYDNTATLADFPTNLDDLYYNLTLAGTGTVELANDLDVDSTMTMNSGSALDMNGWDMNIGGNFVNAGTLTTTTDSTITLDGTTQTFNPSDTVINALLALTGLSGTVTLGSSFTSSNLLTIAAGRVLSLATFIWTSTGDITNLGTINEGTGNIVKAATGFYIADENFDEDPAVSFDSEAIYFTVVDQDGNLDGSTPDTITNAVTVTCSNDSETVSLTEAGNATEVFRYTTGLALDLYDGSATNDDGTLECTDGETMTATYTDPQDNSDTETDTATATTTVHPAAPSGASGTTDSETEITWTWTDNASNEVGFKIYNASNDALVATIATANTTSYQETGLTAGTEYQRYVRAYNVAGNSTASITATATTDPDETVPIAPSGFSGSADSDTAITWTWTDNSSDETGFKLLDSSDTVIATIATANATSYTETGLTADTSYTRKLVAYNGVGNSTATATVAVTTDAAGGDNAPEGLSLIAPGNNTAVNTGTPSFSFSKATDEDDDITGYSLAIIPSSGPIITLGGIPKDGSVGGTTYTADTYIARFSNENDGNPTNDTISITPRAGSSNSLPLAQGTYTWRVSVSDATDNTITTSTRSLTVDTTSPIITRVTGANDAINTQPTIGVFMTDTQALRELGVVLERRRVVLGVPLGYTQVEERFYPLAGTSDDISYVPAQALEVGGQYRLTLTVSDTAGNTSQEQISLQVKTAQQLAQDAVEDERQAAQDAVTELDADEEELATIVERLRELLPDSPTDLSDLTEQATLRREKQAENFNVLFGGLIDRLAQWFTDGTGAFRDGVLAFIEAAEDFIQQLQDNVRLARGWFEQIIISTVRGFKIITYGSASSLFALVGGAGDAIARIASFSISAVSSQLATIFGFDLSNSLAQLNASLAIPLYNSSDIQDRQDKIANTLTAAQSTLLQRLQTFSAHIDITFETGQDTRIRQGLKNRQAINTFLENSLNPVVRTGQRIWRLAQYNIEVLFDQDPTRIENIRVTALNPTSAVIEWDTNHLTRRGKVSYGTDVSQAYTGEAFEEPELSRQHRVEITDLEAETTYFFEIVSQNGGFVFDAYYAFTTPAEGQNGDAFIPQTAIIRTTGDDSQANVPIYAEPTTDSNVLNQSQAGDQFRALTVLDGWTSVLLPSGKRGWVQTEFVEFVAQSGPSGQSRTFDE